MKTPHLDALAAGGPNLAEFYSTCPVCVPSRCTLFTGRYPHSHGIRENYNLLEAGREIHLFRLLKDAGYTIGHSGKNHYLDDQETANFDFFDDAKTAPELDLASRHASWLSEIGETAIWRSGMVHDGPPEATRTWRTAERALGFLDHQSATAPFALCVSFDDPHVPHLALRDYFERYPLDEIEPPPFEGEDALAEKAARWAVKFGAMGTRTATPEQKKRYIAIYRAMIS